MNAIEKDMQIFLSINLVNNCTVELNNLYLEYGKNIKDYIVYIDDEKNRKKGEKKYSNFHTFYSENVGKIKNICNDVNYFDNFINIYSIRGLSVGYKKKLYGARKEIVALLEKKDFLSLYDSYFQQQDTSKNGPSNQGCFWGKLIHLIYPTEYAAIDNAQRKLLKTNNNLFIIDYFVINLAYKKWIKDNPDKIKKIRNITLKVYKSANLELQNPTALSDLRLLDIFLMGINNKISKK